MTAKMIKINLGEKTLTKEATLKDLMTTYKVMAKYEKAEDNGDVSELLELNLDYIIDLFGKEEGITKDDLYALSPDSFAPLMEDVANIVNTIIGAEPEQKDSKNSKSKK